MFSAETIGIALGLALALGIFAFKAATGEYYYCALSRSRIGKIGFLSLVSSGYLGIFALAFFLLDRLDLFRLARNSQAFLQSGTAIHLILCIGLLIWGVRLLCHRGQGELNRMDSHGWLLLTIPCPVCASAIFLVCAFARMLFPDSIRLLYWLVPAFFLFANSASLLLLWGLQRVSGINPRHLAGRVMLLIALYFVMILLIAPQFSKVESLFAAACGAENTALPSGHALGMFFLVVAAITSGFVFEFLHKKGH